MKTPWLSWLLLLLAYMTYGRFLHSLEVATYVWVLSGVFAIALASILTIFWGPFRRMLLLGFQSDAGYSIMVLVLASLSVVAVVQFHLFAYILVLAAVSLLARVDTLLLDLGGLLSFLVLAGFPFLGLGIGWWLP
ncbi:hypothetical protein XM38_032420 [Halomicronema hongdechloris C2206]|uniref:Uncharacterized protein n=1 Tax=Halomicronema hongdechloris C2206 TaxID=1641165 RepID=A0A1Z3HPW4_9CYAN|nr:hypothetical protein [Halomicronema hongdechloris]ASC72286.1 hypothetical protein XM38_032420 [Halomicronema hongdechloris C2206]